MTQVPRPLSPADALVVPGDASTPDSPAAASTAPKAVRPVHRLAVALQREAELEFLRDDDLDSWEAIAERILADTELLDAIAAYLHQRRLPFAHIVMDANTVMVPKGMRNVDLVSTREEAEDILADREEQAIADAQWHKGTRYLIGEIHPVRDTKGERNA